MWQAAAGVMISSPYLGASLPALPPMICRNFEGAIKSVRLEEVWERVSGAGL